MYICYNVGISTLSLCSFITMIYDLVIIICHATTRAIFLCQITLQNMKNTLHVMAIAVKKGKVVFAQKSLPL